MSSKAKHGRQACNKLAHNNKQWVRISRAKNGDCTYCPPNGGENVRKKHSKWGRKRAIKRWYATGKTRNRSFDYINRNFYTKRYLDKGIKDNIYNVDL